MRKMNVGDLMFCSVIIILLLKAAIKILCLSAFNKQAFFPEVADLYNNSCFVRFSPSSEPIMIHLGSFVFQQV